MNIYLLRFVKKKNLLIRNSTAEFLIFTSHNTEDSIEVRYKNETIWLSQKIMVSLFTTSVDNIGLHLKNIYQENELEEEATTEDFSVVQKEGSRQVNRKIKFYNLDAIIAVGYRVNSRQATEFRRWATEVLKQFAIKDYAETEFEKYTLVQDKLYKSDFDDKLENLNNDLEQK